MTRRTGEAKKLELGGDPHDRHLRITENHQSKSAPVQECKGTEDAGRPLRRTVMVDAPSNLLQRLRSFLPQMKEANEDLQRKDPADYSLDQKRADEQQHIDLKLGLGVFEERDGDSVKSVRPEDYEMALLADLIGSESDSSSEYSNSSLSE